MPQRHFSQDEQQNLKAYLQDFADWAMTFYSPQYITKATFSIKAETPLNIGKTKFFLHLYANKTTNLPEYHPKSFFFEAPKLLKNSTKWNPPLPKSLNSFQFTYHKRYEHDIKPDNLADIEGKKNISSHERIRLLQKFGDGINLYSSSTVTVP